MVDQNQLVAARILSESLKNLNVSHAFIGGFAVNMLGLERLTGDVDVMIDVPINESRELVFRAVAQMHDNDRFTLLNNKIIYSPPDGGRDFPLETLPTGMLGLPQQLKTKDYDNLPILHPSVLVLTKIKRCIIYIGSTRPASRDKFVKDERDVGFLLRTIGDAHDTIDFEGYAAQDINRLYNAVKALESHWIDCGK